MVMLSTAAESMCHKIQQDSSAGTSSVAIVLQPGRPGATLAVGLHCHMTWSRKGEACGFAGYATSGTARPASFCLSVSGGSCHHDLPPSKHRDSFGLLGQAHVSLHMLALRIWCQSLSAYQTGDARAAGSHILLLKMPPHIRSVT